MLGQGGRGGEGGEGGGGGKERMGESGGWEGRRGMDSCG